MRVVKYQLPLSRPYQWARGTQYSRDGLIINYEKIGLSGWGEVALLPNVSLDIEILAAIAEKYIIQLDIDKYKDGLDDEKIKIVCRRLDDIECPPAIRCGIVSALYNWLAAYWDISLGEYILGEYEYRNKALNNLENENSKVNNSIKPLDRIRVNSLIASDDVCDCLIQAEKIVSNGQYLIKLKCTSDTKKNIEKINAIKKNFPETKFRLDPNQSWSSDWIVSHLKDLKQFDIEYVEEPLNSKTPLDFYSQIRKESGVAIALDESICNAIDVVNALKMDACDFFVLKIQRLGGIDKFLEVMCMLPGQHQRIVVTSNMESSLGIGIGAHCASVLGHVGVAHGLATFDFMKEDLCTPPVIEYGGYMRLPGSLKINKK